MLFVSMNYDNGVKASDVYEWINEHYNGLNPHYGKQGHNVRLFGDNPVNRCEIWETSKGYDVFIGKETALYPYGNGLLVSGWNEKYNGKKSKNEIALKHVTGSDLALLLKHFEIVQETPKQDTTKAKGKSKGKGNATKSKGKAKTA